MKDKILLWMFVVLLVPTILALSSLGTFEQDKNLELLQVCDNCSAVNLTTVQLPNSSILNINTSMSEVELTYNYTFTGTDLVGLYIYTTCGDPDGVITCESVDFQITTTGDNVDLSNIIIVIVFLVLLFPFYILVLFLKLISG